MPALLAVWVCIGIPPSQLPVMRVPHRESLARRADTVRRLLLIGGTFSRDFAFMHGQVAQGHALQRLQDMGVSIDRLHTMVCNLSVTQLIKSATFDGWLNGLSDGLVRARIQARLDRCVFRPV